MSRKPLLPLAPHHSVVFKGYRGSIQGASRDLGLRKNISLVLASRASRVHRELFSGNRRDLHLASSCRNVQYHSSAGGQLHIAPHFLGCPIPDQDLPCSSAATSPSAILSRTDWSMRVWPSRACCERVSSTACAASPHPPAYVR